MGKRVRFSERMGFKPANAVGQIGEMDSELRISLWNAFTNCYFDGVQFSPGVRLQKCNPGAWHDFRVVWRDFFKQPMDTLPKFWEDVYARMRNFFLTCDWYNVYDLIEFFVSKFREEDYVEDFRTACNRVLEEELSGYRLIGNRIVQITSCLEIGEIEKAMGAAEPMEPAESHIRAAVELLSKRGPSSPDQTRKDNLRNCVKESISAVEAACKEISGKGNGDLGQALKFLANNKRIHPALSQAFNKMYAYTNDADGIRHAMSQESDLEFEDAKYMLVSCSAFVNYLKAKAVRLSKDSE